jgi:hypothetical protein
MLGGMAYLFGAKQWASKLIVAGIGTAIITPVIINWFTGACFRELGLGNGEETTAKTMMVLLAVALIVAVLIYFFRNKIISFLFVILAVYFKLSYWLAMRIIEALIRFPPVLLPQPEKIIVAVTGVLMVQTAVTVLVLIFNGTFNLSDWSLGLPFFAGFAAALIGRFRYLRAEHRGLANVE